MNDNDIQVFNAHSGESIKINRYYFVTLEELKRFCSNQFNIPSSQLFLISPFGIKIKRTTSLEETSEIYVFDKNLFTTNKSDEYIKSYISSQYAENHDNLIQPINSPLLDVNLEKVASSKNTRQMIGLLTTNLGWVAAIESDSALFHKKIIAMGEKIRILFKALTVATQYIDSYCLDVKKNYDSSIDFVISIQNHSLNLTWKDHYKRLKYIPLVDDEEKPLSSLLDQRELENQARECIKLNEAINSELMGYKSKIESSKKSRGEVEKDIGVLESETKKVVEHLESEEDLKELKLLSDKVQADTKHLLNKTKNKLDEIDIELILETLQTHKGDFVSKIFKLSLKLYKIFLNLNDLGAKLQVDLTKQLQRLSGAQSEIISVKEALKNISGKIEQVQNLESSLSHTVDLPLLYGLYIVEDIRRNEWLLEMKSLSSKTVENFASLREKEIKLRSQWVRNFGTILKLLDYNIASFNNRNIANIDLNINEDKSLIQSGKFTKEDALNYVDKLKASGVNQDTINVITKAINDLPLRKSRIKLDDQDTTDANPSDQVIKGYKARIKKLESLLHQEQFKHFSHWPSGASGESKFPGLSRYSLVFDKSQNRSQLRPASGTGQLIGDTKFESQTCDRSLSPTADTKSIEPEELASLRNEKTDLLNKMRKMKDTINITNDELKSIKKDLSSKESENQILLKQLDLVRDENLANLAKLQLQITSKEKEKSQLDELTSKQKQELSNLGKLLKERDGIVDKLKSSHAIELDSLKKELTKKDAEFKEYESKNDIRDELGALRSELEAQRTENSSLKDQLDVRERDLEDIEEKSKKQNEELEKLKKQGLSVKDLESQRDKLVNVNIDLNKDIDKWKSDYNTLSSMKNDLLENMSNRESEFAKEKKSQQEEIESLKMKLEDMDRLQEESHKGDEGHNGNQTILQLVIIINSLIIKSRDLSEILYNNYVLFCSTLRSIGLLAVKLESGEINIIRVKGLRKLGDNNDLSNTIDMSNGAKPDLEKDVEKYLAWTELPDSKLIADLSSTQSEDDQSKSLDLVCETLIENYNLTNFEEKYLSFVNEVTNLLPSFKASVSKRFREVENLAKRELKENKRFKENERQKISIRDFKVDDLVLFLPTRSNIGSSNEDESRSNNWAAFNDMGDMKFLLKNDLKIPPNKQWIIGRISSIEEVENDSKEFLITAEEVVLNSQN